jgi:hypothetical protein
MRSLVIAIFGGVLVAGSTTTRLNAQQDSMTVYGNAPVGHLQPHAQAFSPSSTAEQAVQQKLSAFDAEQQKLDRQLDKSLNICRC